MGEGPPGRGREKEMTGRKGEVWEGEGKGRKGRGRAIPPNENPGYGLRHVSIG